MVCECVYNPVVDLKPVNQTGFVDLVEANRLGSLPADLSVEELSFNEIDDPNAIGGRPSDQFEAAQMNKAILGYKAPKKDVPAE